MQFGEFVRSVIEVDSHILPLGRRSRVAWRDWQ
jgi:hypothetical protein